MEIIEMVKALFRCIAIMSLIYMISLFNQTDEKKFSITSQIALISSAIWFVLVVVTTLQAQ